MKLLQIRSFWCLHICSLLAREHTSAIYFNPDKELPLAIRIYDRITWEHGSGGKFSFIVRQETGGIAMPLSGSFQGKD
jgi:hypothetical protein